MLRREGPGWLKQDAAELLHGIIRLSGSRIMEATTQMRPDDAQPRTVHGVISLFLANVWLALSWMIVHMALGRSLGVEAYGAYVACLTLVYGASDLLFTGVSQSVSIHVAMHSDSRWAILRKGLALQAAAGILVSGCFLLGAPAVGRFFRSQEYVVYVRAAGAAVLPWAFFGLLVGFLNGRRLFGPQALCLAIFACVNLILVAVFRYVWSGVVAALVAFLTAALAACAVSLKWLPAGGAPGSFPLSPMVRFGSRYAMYSATAFLLGYLDLLMVRVLTTGGLPTGLYASAATCPKVLYVLHDSLAPVLFPSIAHATVGGDSRRRAAYITNGVRWLLMLLGGMVLLLSGFSSDLLGLLYGDAYLAAAPALRVLGVGIAGMTFFFVLSSILAGSGRAGAPAIMGGFLVAASLILNLILIPRFGVIGAASATAAAGIAGSVAASVWVVVVFGRLVEWRVVAKIFGSLAFAYLVVKWTELGGLQFPLNYLTALALYVAGLLILRVFTLAEVAGSLRRTRG